MNKKIIIIPIIIITVISIVYFSQDSPEEKIDDVFHITLASSDLYANGVYADTFDINKGDYYFRFVPNGSSPKILSIILSDSFLNCPSFQLPLFKKYDLFFSKYEIVSKIVGCTCLSIFPSACPLIGSFTVSLNNSAINKPGIPTTKKANLQPKISLIQPPANKPNIIPKGIPRE